MAFHIVFLKYYRISSSSYNETTQESCIIYKTQYLTAFLQYITNKSNHPVWDTVNTLIIYLSS